MSTTPAAAFQMVVRRDMEGDYWMQLVFEGRVLMENRVEIQPGQTITMPIVLT